MTSSASADAAMSAQIQHLVIQPDEQPSEQSQETSAQYSEDKTDKEPRTGYLAAKQQSCSPKYPTFDIGFRPFSVKQPAFYQQSDDNRPLSAAEEELHRRNMLETAHDAMAHHHHDLRTLASLLSVQIPEAFTQSWLTHSQKKIGSLEMYGEAMSALSSKVWVWEWELVELMTDVGEWLDEERRGEELARAW
ncbi:MAG: hypothetical protein Q9208_005320 [Pyrenodesmia sp. 3 TL-2023]